MKANYAMEALSTNKSILKNLNEKEEYFLSVVFAIIGLASIYISISMMDPANVVVDEIDEGMLGESVRVEGSVEGVYTYETHQFIEIEDETGRIDLANFDYSRGVEEGDEITVEGTVDLYEGDLQIIVDEVEF